MKQTAGTMRRPRVRLFAGIAATVVSATIFFTLFYVVIPFISYHNIENRVSSFRMCLWQLTMFDELPGSYTRQENGEPACSWRFATDFDTVNCGAEDVNTVNTSLPWNSDTLREWRQLIPRKYCFLGTPKTNVMAIVGKDTAFEGRKSLHRHELPGDLVLIIEVQGTDVHWMAPSDLDISVLEGILLGRQSQITLGTSRDGFLVGFADGEVWMLSRTIPANRLLTFCSCNEAARHDRDDLLRDYQIARFPSLFTSSSGRSRIKEVTVHLFNPCGQNTPPTRKCR